MVVGRAEAVEAEAEQIGKTGTAGVDPGAAAVSTGEVFKVGKVGFQIGYF